MIAGDVLDLQTREPSFPFAYANCNELCNRYWKHVSKSLVHDSSEICTDPFALSAHVCEALKDTHRNPGTSRWNVSYCCTRTGFANATCFAV